MTVARCSGGVDILCGVLRKGALRAGLFATLLHLRDASVVRPLTEDAPRRLAARDLTVGIPGELFFCKASQQANADGYKPGGRGQQKTCLKLVEGQVQ